MVGGAIYRGWWVKEVQSELCCYVWKHADEGTAKAKAQSAPEDFREASVQQRKSNDRENPRFSETEASVIVGTPFQKKNVKLQKFGLRKY